ncbi:Zinc finger and BTB domain-containing protein 17 [Orchesella cincta]|uniref:Zinc finger and BTB domain-containing protein 17 n=1 Tax=Orchesella cincta TaxID=48709 RepID=A0A1D2MQ34_ORCCI|nr:Zinc finger and BTB domain-containing protein 17 [Orchesella cincta]
MFRPRLQIKVMTEKMGKLGEKFSSCQPCPGISLGVALKMIASVELLYFLGFVLHGTYLIAAVVPKTNYVFGAVYIICGLYYLFLTVLSWKISNEPTTGRCYLLVGNSLLILLIVFILTVIRLATDNGSKSSDWVWIILCAFPLQCYFSWVIFAYAKSFNCEDDPFRSCVVKSPSPRPTPAVAIQEASTAIPPPATAVAPIAKDNVSESATASNNSLDHEPPSQQTEKPTTTTAEVSVSKIPSFKTHKYSCKRCKRRFKTKGGLNIHLKQHNPEEYLLKCPDCDFLTFQKGNLVKHTAIIHRKDIDGQPITESIQCTNCDYSCFTEEQLKNHKLRRHTDPIDAPFKCNLCDYVTVEKSALQKHIQICHTNLRPFPCEFCRVRFKTSSSLARHRRSHEEAKPHQCNLCSASYADKKRLRDHIMKHSNEKPFVCPNCDYSTNRKDNLKTHIKRNHMPPDSAPVVLLKTK